MCFQIRTRVLLMGHDRGVWSQGAITILANKVLWQHKIQLKLQISSESLIPDSRPGHKHFQSCISGLGQKSVFLSNLLFSLSVNIVC
jgi:hypothetical protein